MDVFPGYFELVETKNSYAWKSLDWKYSPVFSLYHLSKVSHQIKSVFVLAEYHDMYHVNVIQLTLLKQVPVKFLLIVYLNK